MNKSFISLFCAGLLTVSASYVFAESSSFSLFSSYSTSDSVYFYWETPVSPMPSDYVIYVNGKKQKVTSRQQALTSNVNTALYKEAFYKAFTEKFTGIKGGMAPNDVTFYTASNLKPSTEYKLSVAAVSADGKVLKQSETLTVKTAPAGKVINVKKAGAVSVQKIEDCSKEIIKSNTKVIQNAIDSCPANGTVYIPEGNFVCGGLKLKSDMTLKIDGILAGSPYAEDYEFGFLMYSYYTDKRYWGLINALNAENVIICGKGTVDGQGWDSFDYYAQEGDVYFGFEGQSAAVKLKRYIKGTNKAVYKVGRLAEDCASTYLDSINKTPETATKQDLGFAYATRSTTVILKNVKNLFIQGLTFQNPANHMINIIDSENVTVTGITELTYDANNGDGLGFICSQKGAFYNNFIDSGDDSIVFGAGVGTSALTTGQKGVTDVKIFGNYIHHGHGGVAFGSHTALGISNVQIHDNVFNHTDMPFRVKSAPANGGFVKNVTVKNNAMAYCSEPFLLSTNYNDNGTVSAYGQAETPAIFSDILCEDNTILRNRGYAVLIYADKNYPHHDITLRRNVYGKKSITTQSVENCENFIFE